MSENNTNTANHKKLSKFDILAIICCTVMVGYIFIIGILNISEGYIAILYNIILPFSFYLIIFVVFRCMQIELEKNQNIKREIKSKKQLKISFASAVFLIALFNMKLIFMREKENIIRFHFVICKIQTNALKSMVIFA